MTTFTAGNKFPAVGSRQPVLEEPGGTAVWYEQRAAGLGERYLGEAVEAFFRTAREVRRYLLPHFPYAIIYEVRETECLVVAVAHTARRPGYWSNRG